MPQHQLRVCEVALEAFVHIGGEPRMTPQQQVVEVDVEQHGGCGVKFLTGNPHLEFSELRR
jgi:hypothetical protein